MRYLKMLFLLGLLHFIGYLMPDCFKSCFTLLRLFANTSNKTKDELNGGTNGIY